jgi:hypothetical protein
MVGVVLDISGVRQVSDCCTEFAIRGNGDQWCEASELISSPCSGELVKLVSGVKEAGELPCDRVVWCTAFVSGPD